MLFHSVRDTGTVADAAVDGVAAVAWLFQTENFVGNELLADCMQDFVWQCYRCFLMF